MVFPSRSTTVYLSSHFSLSVRRTSLELHHSGLSRARRLMRFGSCAQRLAGVLSPGGGDGDGGGGGGRGERGGGGGLGDGGGGGGRGDGGGGGGSAAPGVRPGPVQAEMGLLVAGQQRSKAGCTHPEGHGLGSFAGLVGLVLQKVLPAQLAVMRSRGNCVKRGMLMPSRTKERYGSASGFQPGSPA
eukprot:6166546-Pleurochrysis_carterae.AAC.1